MNKRLKYILWLAVIFLCLQNLHAQNCVSHLDSLKFTGYSSHLSKGIKTSLNHIADTIKTKQGCNIIIAISCGNTENKQLNVSNWDRVNNVINYMVKKKGLDPSIFVFRYNSDDRTCNMINISLTNEKITDGAPPHPNIRQKN